MDIKYCMNKVLKLWEICQWDVKTVQIFSNLIASYNQEPATKKLISSMIRFENMYNDLTANPFHFDLFSSLEDKNDYRRALKTRIYMNKKDLVKTVDGKNGKRLLLTSRGHKIYYEEYPLAKLRKEKWNSEWTILTYDFPVRLNRERNFLRRKLTDLGFGCPHESLYVSPLPLSKPLHDLINGEGYKDNVWVVTAKRVLGLGNREVCMKSWNLGMINSLYEKLLLALPQIKKFADTKLYDEWKSHFLALNNIDPYLPMELLPENWNGVKCEAEFHKLGFPSLISAIFKHQ